MSDANCKHFEVLKSIEPSARRQIFKEECTYCFDSPFSETGLDLCLTCYNGGCTGDLGHSLIHYQKSDHPLVANIRKKKLELNRTAQTENPHMIPTDPHSNLSLTTEKIETNVSVRCWRCGPISVENDKNLKIFMDSLISAPSALEQGDLESWKDELVPCVHSEQLTQCPFEGELKNQCSKCDLNTNLWLCLTCGHVGCGRKQFDGTGGNDHAINHYEQSFHPISCKLGTITPEGTADIYCYNCDEMKMDPLIVKHLGFFGINISSQSKTEKSVAELYGYTRWKRFRVCFWPRKDWYKKFRYFDENEDHFKTCKRLPWECLSCQMIRLANGLCTGRYSKKKTIKQTATVANDMPDGITPGYLKLLIGKDHHEFSSQKQQDALEFFEHLIKLIERNERTSHEDPVDEFRFKLHQKIQCEVCGGVRRSSFTTTSLTVAPPSAGPNTSEGSTELVDEPTQNSGPSISLKDCLDEFVQDELIDFRCPSCKKQTKAKK